MKALFVHNDYGKPSGEEHALSTIAGMLEDSGVAVVWHRRSSAELGPGIGPKLRAFITGIHNPREVARMRLLLADERPDVVLAQNLFPLLSPSVLLPVKQAGIRLIMRCPNYRLFCPSGLHLSHGQICERCLGGREHWCVLRNCEGDRFKSLGYTVRHVVARRREIFRRTVDRFVVLSEFQRRRFVEGGIPEDRLSIIPNIMPEVSVDFPAEPGDRILFVGRASPEKGIELFVETARRLPQWTFEVAGDTGRSTKLIETSPPNLRWLGFLDRNELEKAYARARMVVVPALWYEGFPNVIAMAMACHRAVVASRLGCLPEIVEDGVSGTLCEPGSADALTTVVAGLYTDKDRCRAMGLRGRAKAEREYGQKRVTDLWRDVLGNPVG